MLHRVNTRQELEQAASNVVNDMFRINLLLLKNYHKTGQVASSKKLLTLQKSVKLNLKYVKQVKRELEFFKLETLYFEDDMIARLERIRITEKDIIRKTIQVEKYYKEILLDSGIMGEKKVRDPKEKIVTRVVVQKETV